MSNDPGPLHDLTSLSKKNQGDPKFPRKPSQNLFPNKSNLCDPRETGLARVSSGVINTPYEVSSFQIQAIWMQNAIRLARHKEKLGSNESERA